MEPLCYGHMHGTSAIHALTCIKVFITIVEVGPKMLRDQKYGVFIYQRPSSLIIVSFHCMNSDACMKNCNYLY